jgi:xylan 1,4-beta-xylosidase
MNPKTASLPQTSIFIDAGEDLGPFEWWRHSLGHGGINALPLPDRVVQGVAALKPRLLRIFLQEHFDIYPATGRFDWSRLDPYLDSFARTGATLVAALTIKPKVLFPRIDHAVWRPAHVEEWQQVVFQLVKRYSVEKPIITHWEIGNETDIGENGGSPYLIKDPQAYVEYYRMTIAPILRAFPQAKVGGPAACWVENQPLPGFLRYCRETGTQLDFISWHLYHDDPQRHALGVSKAAELVHRWPRPRTEFLVTEWNKSFDPVSAEDIAFLPRRAANVAASIIAMLDARLDWSFYYHIWDQVFYPETFASFFSPEGIDMMTNHWNQVPHRFGLFGVNQEVRPQYFLYQMLANLGDLRLPTRSPDYDLRPLAARTDGKLSALVANFNLQTSHEKIVTLHFADLEPGRKLLTLRRIDSERRWSPDTLELLPVEQREVVAPNQFRCQFYSPPDSVSLLTLEDLP